MSEECHGRAEFEVVRIAEDLLDAPARDFVDQPGALAQPPTEDRMQQVGFGLGTGRDGEVLRHGTVAESLDLRKHEPHPVTRLAPGAQLGHGALDYRCLRLHEAVETRLHHTPPLRLCADHERKAIARLTAAPADVSTSGASAPTCRCSHGSARVAAAPAAKAAPIMAPRVLRR